MKKHKHDNRGRSERGSSYMQLHRWFLDSLAWRSSNVYERCLYLEIKRRYNGANNGAISLSHREAEQLLGCSNKPIPAAFRGLQDKGFIKAQQKGKFKGIPMATTWILTEVPQDLPERHLIPSKDFMAWQPVGNKTPHAQSVPTARPKRAANDGAVRRERAVSTPRAYGEGLNEPNRSTHKAGTYNIPSTYAEADHEGTTIHTTEGRVA